MKIKIKIAFLVITGTMLYGVVSWGSTYKGAGIMPYAINPITGATELLLSRECQGRASGKWSDFGGKRDWFEDDAQETALREYCEESNELCGGYDAMKLSLKKHTTYRLEADGYVMFFVRVAYKQNYNKDFQERLLKAPTHCHKEKDLVLWVSLDKVLTSCRYNSACVVGTEKIVLRNCFVNFLQAEMCKSVLAELA